MSDYRVDSNQIKSRSTNRRVSLGLKLPLTFISLLFLAFAVFSYLFPTLLNIRKIGRQRTHGKIAAIGNPNTH